MLVSFCVCSTQGWVLSNSYGVIRANYRVIDGKLAVCGYKFPDGIQQGRASVSGVAVWSGADKTSRLFLYRDKGVALSYLFAISTTSQSYQFPTLSHLLPSRYPLLQHFQSHQPQWPSRTTTLSRRFHKTLGLKLHCGNHMLCLKLRDGTVTLSLHPHVTHQHFFPRTHTILCR
jgi:hypothetical protein